MTYRIHKSLLSSLILSCLSYNLQTVSALLDPPEGNQGGSCPESSRRRVRFLLDTPIIKALQLKSKKKKNHNSFNVYFTKQNINNIKGMEFVLNSQSLKFRLKCQNRCLEENRSPSDCFHIALCLNWHVLPTITGHLCTDCPAYIYSSSLINSQDVLFYPQ